MSQRYYYKIKNEAVNHVSWTGIGLGSGLKFQAQKKILLYQSPRLNIGLTGELIAK